MQKATQYAIIGGLFLLLLTPLIVANSLFFPFITGKAFFFRIIVELLFALWVPLAVFFPQYRPRRSALLWLASAVVVVLAAATAFGIDPYRSFWSNFERMEGLVGYLHLYLFFILIISVFRTERLWQCFFNSSVAVSVLVAFRGLCQLSGSASCPISQGSARLDATFGNATYLAVYMLIHIFLMAWLWYLAGRERRWLGWVYGPFIMVQLVVLYHTATRGAILGLIGGAALTLLLLLINAWRRPAVRRVVLPTIIAVVLLVGGFWLMRQADFIQKSPVLSRFTSLSFTDRTIESRLAIWQMGWQAVKERPVLGWGPENFIVIFSKYYQPKLWNQEAWFDRSHNIYLDWLINAGVFGLLAYLGLFGGALYYLWRQEAEIATKIIFAGLLAAYAFNNFFVFDNLASSCLFFVILGYIHFRSRPTGLVTPTTRAKTSLFWPYQVAGLVVIIVAGYFVNLKPLLANAALLRSISPNVPVVERLAEFKKVFASDTFASGEAIEQLFGQTQQRLADANTPLNIKQEFVEISLREGSKVLEQLPDARHYLFWGVFLSQLGRYDDALVALETAHRLSPHKQVVLFNLAQTYLIKKDATKALAAAKEAYDSAPENEEARGFYAVVAIFTNHPGIVTALYPQGVPAEDRFIAAYTDTNQWGEAVRLSQKRVVAEPNNTQLRFYLAAAYFAAGNKAAAIKELTTVVNLNTDPTTKAQAAEIIQKIRSGKNPLVQ